jgi:uncharacterized protein with von Willebrand factor type A (vWA) domain
MFADAIARWGRWGGDAVVSLAENIWRGVTASGEGGLVSQAVADTTPPQYATLLATDDIAASYATATLLSHFAAQVHAPTSPHTARQIAHAGWAEFRALADQAGHVQHGLGGDLSAAWPVFKQYQNMQADDAKLRRIAELAGRMYRLLKGAKAQRVEGIPEEIVGTELGQDIAALVPQEYALWAAGVPTRTELALRLSESRAVQLQRAGKDIRGRGPLVIALDESGSMHHQRDDWAKAAMTALTRMAWEERRPVKIVHFSTVTRVQELQPGDHRELLRAQALFLDGGTAIGRAVMVASEEVDEWAKKGVRGADVVLISDGGDAAGGLHAALDVLERHQTRLFSVAIDVAFTGPLKERATEYVYLTQSDMRQPQKVTALKGAVR